MASLEEKGTREEKYFPKEEKLKSTKVIEELFKKGSSIYLYPYRIFYFPGPPPETSGLPQVLITVPKRNFKRSVDRNRLRRQIREAYRLNKGTIFNNMDKEKIPACIAFVYTTKEKIPFKILQEKLILVLERLKNSKS